MNRNPNEFNLKLAVAAALLLPLFMAASVFAQTREVIESNEQRPGTPPSASNPTTTEQKVQTMESTTAENPTATDTRIQRIEERKARLNIELSAKETAKLKRLCQPTQAKLERYRQRVVGVSTSQNQTSEALLERLNRLSDKLRLANVETAELNQKISGLENGYNTLLSNLETFAAAVDDGAEMECAEDPEGYKAALVEARQLRAKVVVNAKTIKNYINNELKPVIVEAQQALAGTSVES